MPTSELLDLPAQAFKILWWLEHQPGPIQISIRNMAATLRLGRDTTRKCLHLLEKHGLIVAKNYSGHSRTYEIPPTENQYGTPTSPQQGVLETSRGCEGRSPHHHRARTRLHLNMNNDNEMRCLRADARESSDPESITFARSLGQGLDGDTKTRLLSIGVANQTAINLLREYSPQMINEVIDRAEEAASHKTIQNFAGYVVRSIGNERTREKMAQRRSIPSGDDERPKKRKGSRTWKDKETKDWTSRDLAHYFRYQHLIKFPGKLSKVPSVKQFSQIAHLLKDENIDAVLIRSAIDWLFENWEQFSVEMKIANLPHVGILVGFIEPIVARMRGYQPPDNAVNQSGGNRYKPFGDEKMDF